MFEVGHVLVQIAQENNVVTFKGNVQRNKRSYRH